MKPIIGLAALLVFAVAPSAWAGTEKENHAASFSAAEISLWEEKSFKGRTDYEVVPEEGSPVLKASCDKTASAFYRRMPVDLTRTPILRWSWKIEGIHDQLDDISKEGDDYAARVYVVYKGAMPWDVIAVDYVWANTQPAGASWPNAYTKRAIMVAQKSGEPENKEVWINEARNVREDFKKYFGRDVTRIDGVAIMTDCDNGGGKATGHYRNIRFTPSE